MILTTDQGEGVAAGEVVGAGDVLGCVGAGFVPGSTM
jgi:hypothetical protein